MNWLLNRVRISREHHHQRKVMKLEQEKWDRIQVIEERYKDLDFFASPGSAQEDAESGVIPDAREKYLLYLLQRVGIQFIPDEALALARRFGPKLATERVCLWLGLDYHKIAAVAPRVASETVRATLYFEEIQRSCDHTGISADALLPHIHFGSHDTRDILFESFRTSSRVIELYDGLNESIKEYIGWEEKRPIFVDNWKGITSECLMKFYKQGLLLSEYRKNIDLGAGIIKEHSSKEVHPLEKYLSGEAHSGWQWQFPEFEVVQVLVHHSNQIREFDYKRSREWNRILKAIVETDFDFEVQCTEGGAGGE